MERWVGKVAVVTGASSGIGASIAEELATKGVIVAAFGRREDRLKELAAKSKGTIHAVKCDVSKEDSILDAFRKVEALVGGVDILINCAGVLTVSKLTSGATEDWRSVLETNVLGLSICTREAIRTMRQRGDNGHIIHINSVSGHYIPQLTHVFFGLYPASKFAVTALTESLRVELGGLNSSIKVTSISPGAVYTEMAASITRQMNVQMPPQCPVGYLEAQDVSGAIMYALSTRPGVQIHEIIIRAEGVPEGRLPDKK